MLEKIDSMTKPVLLTAALLSPDALADDQQQASCDISGIIGYSSHFTNSIGQTLSAGPNLQGGVTASCDDTSFTAWGNLAAHNEDNGSSEIDFTAAHSFTLTPETTVTPNANIFFIDPNTGERVTTLNTGVNIRKQLNSLGIIGNAYAERSYSEGEHIGNEKGVDLGVDYAIDNVNLGANLGLKNRTGDDNYGGCIKATYDFKNRITASLSQCLNNEKGNNSTSAAVEIRF